MVTLLSIIILSFNTKKLTIKCLESISRQYKKQLESGVFEIVVVDNRSADNTVSAIQQFNLPRGKAGNSTVKVIENKENVGFSKGNNIGAKKAKGKYLFFLNSDTQVGDDGLLRMTSFLDKNEEIAIAGARLVNMDGTSQPSVGKFYNLVNTIIMLFGGERIGLLRQSPQKISRVDWVSGGAMMVRADLFKKLGGFDERFFMYMEDMEFCWRAKRKGIATYFYPGVSIIHQQLGSSNRTFAILNIYKGLLYFYKKHANYREYLLVKLLLAVKACMAILIGMLTGNAYIVSTYRKALALLI